MNRIEEIKELTKKLNEYRYAYYNNSESLVSDKEYDELFDELRELENEIGIVMSNSPTQTVGYEVKSELNKVKHSHPMLSLDKTKSENDLKKFSKSKESILSLKLDGLTILITYENGKLVKGETRGDGEIGEDITHNVKVFENIPLKIDYKEKFEIEGEAIITYDDFEEINKTLPNDKKYKNPRNLVSGSVRQLDSKVAAKRHIKFIAWKVPTIKNNKYSNSFLYRLNYAKCLGFETVPFLTYSDLTEDKDNLSLMIKSLKHTAEIKKIPIDGMVMTYNDIMYGESLGMTGHHPKHSIAFKFYEDEEETILRNIEWSIGKTGTLTPVANFDSVELAGTEVSRASLHNISIMKELNISIGSTVTVVKKNEIIPQIIKSKSNTMDVTIPSTCPICGGDTKIVKDNDSEVLTCTNPYCKGKLLGRLSHFVSKKGMNVDGLSEETLKKFIDLGWLNNINDIYKLPMHFKELSKMDGFGQKSVDKLHKSLEKSKTSDLKHFICALSIPNVGTSQAKELAKQFKTWNNFSDAGFGNYDFSKFEGFGSVLNSNIHKWFSAMFNEDKIEELVKNIVFNDDTVSQSDILNGKTFVITGSLNHFANRDELKNTIESMCGKVAGSVSKNTFALINNDKESNSSKNKKAKSLGVQIISEEQLIKMIKGD